MRSRWINVPTAWMGLCWKSEPTMVSHTIVEGIPSVWSSRAVNLCMQVGQLVRIP